MLRELSLLWSMIHTLLLFLLLFESRYPRRTTQIVSFATMIPLIAINSVLIRFLGEDMMGILMLVTLSLPSLIVFWILAKNRDGRFFFTFCFVDTVVLEILYISNILNHYITPDSDIFLFVVRLICYPLLEILAYWKLRGIFLGVQKDIREGWGVFAVIGALFYVLMTAIMTYPFAITDRPEYLPIVTLLFILVPVIYIHIISTLRRQQKLHELTVRENILKLQVSNLTARMEELSASDERSRMERHNFRHKLKTIASLLKTEQYDDCRALLEEYSESLEKTKITRYCHSSVVDAVLSAYIQKAEAKGIPVTFGFAFPYTIPMSETELATALANALENAINACEKVVPGKRYIDIKVLSHPRFIIQIANSYVGTVEFDENDVPVSHEEDHGFGTRFIAAFCDKNGGFYQFKAEDGQFTLYLNF